MHNNEKIVRRCKATHEIKCQFRRRFFVAQRAFDILIKNIIYRLHNPTDLWDKINNMGVRNKCFISNRVYKNDLLTSEQAYVGAGV